MDPRRHPPYHSNPMDILPSQASSHNWTPHERQHAAQQQPAAYHMSHGPHQTQPNPQNYYPPAFHYNQPMQWQPPPSYPSGSPVSQNNAYVYPAPHSHARPAPPLNPYNNVSQPGMSRQPKRPSLHTHTPSQEHAYDDLAQKFQMNRTSNQASDKKVPRQEQKKFSTLPPQPQPKEIASSDGPVSSARRQEATHGEKPVARPDVATDHRLLLLSLADQYFSEARRIAPQVAKLSPDERRTSPYYALLANGLGYYEVVLRNAAWKLSPRQEASLRLRLASIRFDEVHHSGEVEQELSKGIQMCERNRLYDLKYSMHHLLIRMIHNSQPKAAMKHLDGVASEARAMNHHSWVYALHFLRLSLLQSSSQDPRAALSSLRIIEEVATTQRESAILAMGSMMEVLLHHRTKGPEHTTEMERALASARAHLMSAGQHKLPQLEAMLQLIDLMVSLAPFTPKAAEAKALALQTSFDQSIRKSRWPSSGRLAIPLKAKPAAACATETGGIFEVDADGHCCLNFQWLDKIETFAIGYLLCAINAFPKNTQDGKLTAERMLKEAARALDENDRSRGTSDTRAQSSLSEMVARGRLRQHLRCHIYTYLSIAQAARSAWDLAAVSARELIALQKTLGSDASPNLRSSIFFIQAVMYHHSGNLEKAISYYKSPELALSADPQNRGTQVQHELSILSALSIVLIAHDAQHPSHKLAMVQQELLKGVFAFERTSVQPREADLDPQLTAACALVMATTQSARDSSEASQLSFGGTKAYLQVALQLSQRHANFSIMTAAVSYMHTYLFRGQVGDEALATVSSAQQVAKHSGSLIWQVATDGLAADAYQRNGQKGMAQSMYEHGTETAARLPRRVQEQLKMPSVAKTED